MDVVKYELKIEMNYTTRREYVPKDKCNKQTIVDSIHAHYHNLTYKATPKVILRYLETVSTETELVP